MTRIFTFFYFVFFDNPGKSGTTFLVKSFLCSPAFIYFNLSNYDGLGPLTFLTRCIITFIPGAEEKVRYIFRQVDSMPNPLDPPSTSFHFFRNCVFFHQKNHDIYAENELILVKCSGLNWIGKNNVK